MIITELKKVIYNFLITCTKNCYDIQAPANVSYPYLVYDLEDSNTDDNQVQEEFVLRIEAYDKCQFDMNALDTLIGSVDGDGAIKNATGLHRKHYYSSVIQADFYRTSRGGIEENEKQSRGRYLEYEVQAYLT
jgi:hypothetical protein